MTIQRFRFGSVLMSSLLFVFLGTGCVTSGRRVLLKEYGPSIPVQADANLKGTTVCIQGFTRVTNLVSLEIKTDPEEPEPFEYMNLTKEQDKQWASEMKALQKQTPKEDWILIGNMRNGFGMVMSHVYALNDPAGWLVDSLKYDLEAQGATVVDASKAAEADVLISGTIELCRADMYFTVNGSLVVDLDVKPKQGESRRRQIHTHGATAAMLASEGEYFHALRDARQKWSILVIREIAQALKTKPQP